MVGFVARLIAVILLSLSAQAIAQSETRVALVIANGAYANVSRLPNPPRVGQLIAQSLRRAGFTTVEINQDLPKAAFDQALLNFRRLADSSDVALIYFAGHGLEVDGINWLLPIDARLQQATDIHLEAVSLDNMLRIVGGARRLRVVILDACRNNPFAARLANGRSVMRGLRPVEGLPRGTLVAYSASSGQMAADGETGSNSPFAVALADRLAQPGLEIRFLFAHVRDDVMAANPQGQEPWLGFSLSAEEFFFVPGSRQSSVVSDQGAEVAAFNLATRTWTADGWRAYLRSYPSGQNRQLAEAALAGFARQTASPQLPAQRLEAARRAIASLTPQQIDASSAYPLIPQVVSASSREALEQLASGGDAVAQWLIGAAYSFGIGGFPRDLNESVRLQRLSADAGFARGQAALGSAYFTGHGALPQNSAEAVRLYRLAAAQNNAHGISGLGIAYAYGAGVAADHAEARRLLEIAAARGSDMAIGMLGTMHLNGIGGAPNPAEALRLFRRAAMLGEPNAQQNLAGLYLTGAPGLERNEVEAVRLLRLAANASHPYALNNLGTMFQSGRGGLAQNEHEAVRLYRLAADQNNPTAQLNLGVMYERGVGGLTQDLVEAERLYRLAAAQGLAGAQDALNRLRGN